MKIIVTDEVAREGLALLEQDPRVELEVRLGLTVEELHAIIGEYEVLITRSGTTVDRPLLDAARNLKLGARAGVGIDEDGCGGAHPPASATPTAPPNIPWRSCWLPAAT